MPRLSSLSSRSLTGLGISVPAALPSVISYYGATGLYNTVSDADLNLVTSDQAKWGTRSLMAPTVSGYAGTFFSVDVPLSETISPPFTAEGWVRHSAAYTAPNYYGASPFTLYNTGSNVNSGIRTYAGQSITVQQFWQGSSGPNWSTNDSGGPSTALDTWVHVAISWHTTTSFSVWLNGTRKLYNSNTGTLPSVMGSLTTLRLNPSGAGIAGFYYDDIRVSKIDRYGDTATITVPSSNFTPDANTVALVNFETPSLYEAVTGTWLNTGMPTGISYTPTGYNTNPTMLLDPSKETYWQTAVNGVTNTDYSFEAIIKPAAAAFSQSTFGLFSLPHFMGAGNLINPYTMYALLTGSYQGTGNPVFSSWSANNYSGYASDYTGSYAAGRWYYIKSLNGQIWIYDITNSTMIVNGVNGASGLPDPTNIFYLGASLYGSHTERWAGEIAMMRFSSPAIAGTPTKAPNYTRFSKTASDRVFILANTVTRYQADLGSYGPSNGVRLPTGLYASNNGVSLDGVDRSYVFRGKNSSGTTLATYTPNSVMTLFFVSPATYSGDGYGDYAFLSASAFGTIPSNYNSGAGIRDVINTTGVTSLEVSWTGMTNPYVITLNG